MQHHDIITYKLRYYGDIYLINIVNDDEDGSLTYWIEYPGDMIGSDFVVFDKTHQQVIESIIKEICNNDSDFIVLKREFKLYEILH
jgi:hypothetical protein